MADRIRSPSLADVLAEVRAMREDVRHILEDRGPELLTAEQAADFLGCSLSYLAHSRSSGIPEIPYEKIGRNIRYRRSDLEAHRRRRKFRNTASQRSAA